MTAPKKKAKDESEPKKRGRPKKDPVEAALDKDFESRPRLITNSIADDPSKNKPAKKRKGNPNSLLPPDKRKICGAKCKQAGQCDSCGFAPVRDQFGHFNKHKSKCINCGGTMRCRSWALMPNGRCRLHAGKRQRGILSPAFKHGLKDQSETGYNNYLPPKLAEILADVQKEQDRLSVQKEIDLLDTFLRDLLPRMKGAELWDKADKILSHLEHASLDLDDPDKIPEAKENVELCVGRFRNLIRKGHNDADLRKELRGIMEDKSRIAAREARRQLEQRMHMSVEEGTALLAAVGRLAIDNVDRMPNQLMLLLQTVSDGLITPNIAMDKLIECISMFKKDMAQGIYSLMHINNKSTVQAIENRTEQEENNGSEN